MSHTNSSGSRWWKIDFHAHSPHSFDFGGLEETKSDIEVSFEDWLLTYMRAEIDAIVITDHNCHTGVAEAQSVLQRLKETAHEDFRQLTIFPGVEITTEGGFHLLAVFDPSESAEAANGVIHNSGYGGTRGASTETTSKSFHDVCKIIVDAGGLPIPAHADGPMGVFGAERRTLEQIKGLGVVAAVELIASERVSEALQAEWIPVLGSDAHHLDSSLCPPGKEAKFPGSHFTWMKMQTLDLNGVRLALADGGDSVLRSIDTQLDPNDVEHNRIERVVVRRGEDSSEVPFGPWLTSLIGGRGVGKSTIVEVIRLCLGRFAELPPALHHDLEWFSATKERSGDIRFWDEHTEIEFHYRKNGNLYRVLWDGSTPSKSQIEVDTDGTWISQEGSVADRFPILIYSQKQVYETAKNTQSLLSIIDAQPEISHAEWLETFQLLKSEYAEKMQKTASNATLIESETRLRGELTDVDAELAKLIALRDSGEMQELDRLAAAETAHLAVEREAELFESRLRNSIGDFATLLEGSELASRDWQPWTLRHAAEVEAVASIRATVAKLETSRLDLAAAGQSPGQKRIDEIRQKISQDLAASGDSNSIGDPDGRFVQLTAGRSNLVTRIDEVERAKASRKQLIDDAEGVLELIKAHRTDLTRRRRKYLADLQLDATSLKLDLFEMADQSSLETDLREITQKPSSYEGFYSGPGGVQKLLKSDSKNPSYLGELNQLKGLLSELRSSGPEAPTLAASGVAIDARLITHLSTIDATEFAINLALWFPEDLLRVRYKMSGESNFRGLEQGSPGQKTATLLSVILRMSSDPLILDQPEDDLDNELITDLIVTTLKQIKKRRQVIVVTHNANIVVNADSEHVSVLKHGPVPLVGQSGSIQEPLVKDAICRIMEGGETAFASRYRRLVS